VLKGSTLSYYKSEEESDFGCRGAIALEKALVKESEVDDCRFEIYVDNLVWYLRTDRPEDRRYWVDVLRSFRVRSKIKIISNIQLNFKIILDQ
jgi:collagen type IV alpha-3-binding protein